MPEFDLSKLVEEDKLMEECDVPYRFGKAFDVSYSMEDGIWYNCGDERFWTITFESTGAISLNFVFGNFHLSKDAALFIVNDKQTNISGPITSKDIGKNGFFLTDIIYGDKATIILKEPSKTRDTSTLTIKRIIHGYRSIGIDEYYGNNGTSAICNVDVACKPAFSKEAKAVGLVLLSSGNELCSGSLLMTTDMSLKPYFLTAFHCIDIDKNLNLSDTELNNAENWMFKFHHKRAICGDSTLATSYTYNSAIFRSAWYNTDFALMEIDHDLIDNKELSWLGWDRTETAPSYGYCIHHPQGDVMKINTTYSSFDTSSWNGIDNHWYVNWYEGVTEGGSSGAPFLNQNKLVVGQNHGKLVSQNYLPVCDRKRSDAGMFYKSWTGGGTDNSRLSNWLDPLNTDSTTITTCSLEDRLKIVGPTVVCDSAVYFVEHLPVGMTVTWTRINQSYGCTFLTNYPQPNQCIIKQVGNTPYEGTLVARIFHGGNLVIELQKEIYIKKSFYATYSQEACTYHGVNHPAITQHIVALNNAHFIHQGCNVEVKSENFKGLNVSHRGIPPASFSYDGNQTVTFSLPYGSSGAPFYVTAHQEDNCSDFDILFFSISGNGNIASSLLNIESTFDGYILNIKPIHSEENPTEKEDDNKIVWNLELYNILTGERKLKTKVNGSKYLLQKSNFKTGNYIIVANYENQIFTNKIRIE